MSEPPVLRIVRGDATDEEIAALVAVVAARAGGGGDAAAPEPEPFSAWTDRRSQLRQPPAPGPGAWRASAWPR